MKFGFIQYFLKIDKKLFIAINKLEILGNIINNIKGRASNVLNALKHSGVFFSYVSEINNTCQIESDKPKIPIETIA